MLRYSLPSQTRALHKVAAGLALVAALTALVTGLVMAGTIDIPSLGDEAEADRPPVIVPSMHQSDPPLPAEQTVVQSVIVPSMHQSDPPLPAEQPVIRSASDLPMVTYDAPMAGEGRIEHDADDVSVDRAPSGPKRFEP